MFGRGGVAWICLALLTASPLLASPLSGARADAGGDCSVGSQAAFCEPKDKAKDKAKEKKQSQAARAGRRATRTAEGGGRPSGAATQGHDRPLHHRRGRLGRPGRVRQGARRHARIADQGAAGQRSRAASRQRSRHRERHAARDPRKHRGRGPRGRRGDGQGRRHLDPVHDLARHPGRLRLAVAATAAGRVRTGRAGDRFSTAPASATAW